MFELDRGRVKWPTKPVLLDTDMFEVEDSWHDTPPEGFKLTVSRKVTLDFFRLLLVYLFKVTCPSSVVIICNDVDGTFWMDNKFFYSLHLWVQ